MKTQELILSHVEGGTARDFIPLLQAAATGLRGAELFDDIGSLSELDAIELRGLFDEEKHVGISAPKNAYAMAGLAGAAWVLVSGEESSTQELIRRATFARPPAHVPRGVGYGPGSPAELLIRWSRAPEPFRAQILRALDRDFTITQRILFDTAVHPHSRTAHGDPTVHRSRRAAGIPMQLWPAWCSRLDIGGNVDSETLEQALASAVSAVGTKDATLHETEVRLAAVLRPNMLGTPEQTTRLLSGISELAHIIDTSRTEIDYRQRRRLPASDLLVREHWEMLADSVHLDPGGERRQRNARRYLWQRLTATGVDAFPEHFKLGLARDDRAEYTAFRTRMTAELQAALDRYAAAYLIAHGDWQPVTSTPMLTVHLDWPGTEITDLDIELLHSMLRDGIFTHRTLAASLGVSTRRVVRAIDAVPPLIGQRVDDVGWQQLLPPLLARESAPDYSPMFA